MSAAKPKVIDQKAYLKKYLSGDKEKKKKKREKKLKKSAKVKIIDDDAYEDGNPEMDEDLLFGGEDAPQIVGEYIEEAPNAQQIRSKWRNIAVKEEVKEEPGESPPGPAIRIKQEPLDEEQDLWGRKATPVKVKDEFSPPRVQIKQEKRSTSRDLSPQRTKKSKNRRDHSPARREKHRKASPGRRSADKSPPRRVKDSDQSPPRRKRRDSDQSPPRRGRERDQSPPRRARDSDQSPPRRKRRDSDQSPPRRGKNSDQSPPRRGKDRDLSPPRRARDSDQSPPRRKRRDSDQSPPRRAKNSDQSPPRRDRNKDQSPPRRRRRDSDQSPPRKHRNPEPSPTRKHRGSDQSPPRRRKNEDQSPPRRKRNDSDQSPPRKRRDSDQSPPRRGKDAGQSPPRRGRKDSDQSPPRSRDNNPFKKETERKSRWASKSLSPPPTHKPKSTKTLDGKKAGLQDAQSLKKESDERRRREHDLFEQMSSEVSGRDAEVQMRSTGRKGRRARAAEEEDPAERKRKEEHELKKKELYDRWGRGLKQIEQQKSRLEDMAHEAAKPVARYANDEDLDRHLREQEHADDPMLEYIRSKRKQRARADNKPEVPQYEGSFPENRFGIRPGYRWDGVDRSNGYEKRWFDKQNEKRALRDEAYKYSVEDM
ncbi:hypothetical protein KR018_004320 [Drosophila ironensis]|nr:hypothetical protein KR018_004320 [Drosophila ironensis]